jgi:hypothetical protein
MRISKKLFITFSIATFALLGCADSGDDASDSDDDDTKTSQQGSGSQPSQGQAHLASNTTSN